MQKKSDNFGDARLKSAKSNNPKKEGCRAYIQAAKVDRPLGKGYC
jgi:hypothetical protein